MLWSSYRPDLLYLVQSIEQLHYGTSSPRLNHMHFVQSIQQLYNDYPVCCEFPTN